MGDTKRLEIVDALRLGDRTPQELAEMTGLAGNLLAHHLGVLESAAVIRRRVSWGDRRRRYVVLNEDVVEAIDPPPQLSASSVVFLCTHNSARSQFAEALAREVGRIEAQSAGTLPASTIHPKALRIAKEHGLDMSEQHPKPYSAVAGTPDLVISVCDRACEADVPFTGTRLHWSVPDPVEGNNLKGFRTVFEEISERVDRLVGAIE